MIVMTRAQFNQRGSRHLGGKRRASSLLLPGTDDGLLAGDVTLIAARRCSGEFRSFPLLILVGMLSWFAGLFIYSFIFAGVLRLTSHEATQKASPVRRTPSSPTSAQPEGGFAISASWRSRISVKFGPRTARSGSRQSTLPRRSRRDHFIIAIRIRRIRHALGTAHQQKKIS